MGQGIEIMDNHTALIGGALALIDCLYQNDCHSPAPRPVSGWDGDERRQFADFHLLHSEGMYNEAHALASIPVLLYAEQFDPMRTDQEPRRAWFRVTYNRLGAQVRLDLESNPPPISSGVAE